MVSNFVQKNVTILRIILIFMMITYYISSTLYATNVKVILNAPKNNYGVVSLENNEELFQTLASVAEKKKNFKVVIDAGHGGHDPGAVGKNSTEKELVLKMSIKLTDMIQKMYPEIEVIQTRTTDVFIPLFRRIQFANEQNADLFISIHCNYISSPKTRGTETFVMGLHRAGENLEVAKRENASILLESNFEANYDGYNPNSPEGHIIMSMFQNNYLDKSIELAADIEAQFAASHMSKSRGVKQAGFAVLRRASMPAVLVEAGFLSNEAEEAYLMSDEGQQAVTDALLKAIGAFYKNNQNNQVTPTEQRIEQTNDVVTSSNKSTKNTSTEGSKKESTKTQTANGNQKISHAENKPTIYYKVQIAALKNETADLDTPELRKIGKLSLVNQKDVNKYLVGDFISRESAEIAREKLKNLGYKGAFIVLLQE
ncbi:MAG TPA: N-acetylmuramoyl-L-alanine amidase [Saprospiraceae bacterium]|jgi:N-acetylmuramoyl-L-alanine amidase|nr:N-acetylmuramoyl-L-alanine amidase [Saprospiraceae bacterium]HMT69776.1 N-acetylmuramoyl-L-alanine amidase [Saprospiraceae bacterium]